MDRPYTRPKMGGGGPTSSNGYGSRGSERDRERDRETDRPVRSVLRPSARQRRNSDTSITSSNTPAVGSDSEMGLPEPRHQAPPAQTLPRKVLKARFPGERHAVVSLRSSRAASSTVPGPQTYHVPPVRSIMQPQYGSEVHDSHLHDDDYRRHRDDRDLDTESVSESSDLSSSTQATTVVSAASDFSDDVAPEETRSTSQVRFTPSTAGSSSVGSPPSRKVKPRLGTRARAPSDADRVVAKKGGQAQTVNIKLLPPTSTREEEIKHRRELERSLLQKIEQLESESQSLRESQARLTRELDTTSVQLSTVAQEKKAAEKERDLERGSKEKLFDMLEEQKRVLDEFRSNLDLQKGMLDETEQERDQERAYRAELQTKLDQTRHILDELRCNFELQKVMLAEAEKERDEIKEAKDSFEEKFAGLERDLVKLQVDRKERDNVLVHQMAALELTIGALEGQRDARDMDLAAVEADRDQLEEEKEQLQSQVTALTGAKRAAAEEEQQRIREAAEEEQQRIKGAAEQEQHRLQTRIGGLEKEKEELDKAKAALEGEKTELQSKLETAESEIGSLQSRVQELETAQSELDNKSTGLLDEISAIKAAADDLRSQIENLEADKASLLKQVVELQAAKVEHEARLHVLNTDLGGAKAANVSLATQKLDLAGDMAKVQQQLDAAKAEVDKLTGHNAALQAAADRVPGLETAKAGLETKIAELERQVSRLNAKVAALQSEADKIPGLHGEKAEVSAKVADLENKVSELEGKIAEVQAEADKLPDVTAAKADLESKVGELQAKVSELQQQQAEAVGKDPGADANAAAAAAAAAAVVVLKAELQVKTQEINQRVAEIAALTQGNSALSSQVGATRQQLDQVMASYQAASGQVMELQQKVDQLVSQQRQERRPPRSRTSSPRKKEGRGEKQLVVVRNPGDRGAVSVMLQIAAGI
ncbi:paramyosin [Diplogelasinospora grovesii]|uniref:Paramyosin n=1 Tax=Diplogelasinospora grovesii TaxID=303347 RepID=A0AAN6N2H5_9PEZI|nr:paramyosin [Diplogelasinospora grovesii]